MSSMANHRRRSRRGKKLQRSAFGKMERQAWVSNGPVKRSSYIKRLADSLRRMARKGRNDRVGSVINNTEE